MGLFGFLGESRNNRKTARYQSNSNDSSPTSNRSGDYGANVVGVDKYNVWQLISKLRDLNNNYKYKYAEYEAMADDVIIQSALELYADDSTQVDTKTERIVMIESEDKTLAADLNAFLESIEIESRIWNWAYSVSQYGDYFLKLYVDPDTHDIRIDDNTDPSLIMDLYEDGIRVGYAEEDTSEYRNLKHRSNPNGLDLIISSPDNFVHFMIRKSAKYDILELPIQDETDENGDPLIRKFTVVRGVSMVEGVRSIFRILQLLEDSLLAARIAKAEFIRVFNVEVGDSTPAQTTDTINSVKNLFDSKATFDVNSGRYVSTKAYRPIGDPIFNPTRNGKGSVTHENIGGDFQVRDIVDIDYFKNKLFSGLKIPKALLGFEESLPGGLGDNTLTRLDIRYSRSVKRVQNSLIVGIKDLCKIWLRVNNYSNDSDFKVVLQAPSTAEELGRLTEMDQKMSTISSSVRTLSEAFGEYLNLPKVFKVFFDQYINYPELKEKLNPELDEAIKRYEKHLEEQEQQRKAELELTQNAADNTDPDNEDDEDGVGDYQGTSNRGRTARPDLNPKKLTEINKEDETNEQS
jgi:hypothetical protein